MSDIAIRVDGLGKAYKITHQAGGSSGPYRTLREDLVQLAKGVFSRQNKASREIVWAIRDISFEVKQGEVLGVIGRNGAGKSTLLKVLSRITRPTEGEADVFGRVGSLLEVGTGFHNELTGRENIFLSGAVLGMRREEIRRRFDEIVEFAGVEKFLDTPVKRYSSGMYMRLAFSVAAHLDTEVLLIDEVLAVGDAAFQKKCLGKMDDVAKAGRTVLFVSHDLSAISQLCNQTILLDKGRKMLEGSTRKVIDQYLQPLSSEYFSDGVAKMIAQLPPDPVFRFLDISILQEGKLADHIANGKPLEIVFKYEVFEKTVGLRVFFDLFDLRGQLLVRSFNDEQEAIMSHVLPGKYVSQVTIPANLLTPKIFYLHLNATIFNVRDLTPGVTVVLEVEATGTVNRGYPTEPFRGTLTLPVEWKTAVLT